MEKLVSVIRQGICLYLLLLLATRMVGCSIDRAYLVPPPDLETVDFGDVYLGTFDINEAYWINRGPKPTRFTGRILIDQFGQSFDFSSTGDEVIQPGAQTQEVYIDFIPYEERTYRAEASPIVWDKETLYNSITLLGNGVAQRSGGELSLAGGNLVPTRALDFGGVLVGTSLTRGFNISNSSNKEITVINNRWFYGPFQDFRVTTPATNLFNVPPQGNVPVRITFSPPRVGRFNNAVTFRDVNVAGNNFAGTAVNGRGVARRSGGALSLAGGDLVPRWGLDFGNVLVGSHVQRAFNIQNQGPAGITVNVTWAKGDQGFGVANHPAKIPAWNSPPVIIDFTPPRVGTFTDAVTFSDAIGMNLAATSVTGEGVTYISRGGLRLYEPGPQQLEILETLDFGRVQVGGTATRTFHLINIYSSEVIITSAGLGDGKQGFSSDVSPPVTLGPGASLTVTITFAPFRVGTFEDAVTFSDASGANMAGVMVRGQGVKGE